MVHQLVTWVAGSLLALCYHLSNIFMSLRVLFITFPATYHSLWTEKIFHVVTSYISYTLTLMVWLWSKYTGKFQNRKGKVHACLQAHAVYSSLGEVSLGLVIDQEQLYTNSSSLQQARLCPSLIKLA